MGELGSWLIRAREARGLTIEDAERDTRISRRYLQALESEQYEVIPAPVYARGFLRSYSQYLGLDPVEMLELFPRDDESPAPVIGRTGNVGVGTAQSARGGDQPKPSLKSPAPAQSAARPSWRAPGRSNPAQPQTPMPKRPPSRRAPQPAAYEEPDDDHIIIGATAAQPAPRRSGPTPPPPAARNQPQPFSDEPMIGVDIGVPPTIGATAPVPKRKLQQDAAAPARNLTVLGVAAGAIILVVALAYLISRAGSDGSPGAEATATTGPGITTSRDATATAQAAAGASGTTTGVTPGIVPAVEGMTVERARQSIIAAGFKVTERREKSSTVPRNTVIQQAPAAGREEAEGTQVFIIISDGP